MTDQDIYCWFGFHGGMWGEVAELQIFEPRNNSENALPIRREYAQFKTCPYCGAVSIRKVGSR